VPNCTHAAAATRAPYHRERQNREVPVSEPVSPEQVPAPATGHRPPTWAIVATAAGLVVLGVVAGVVIARVRQRDLDPTAVGCITTTVAERGLPSVVTINVRARGAGSGSGEVISREGYILTNNHVISAASNGGSISVLFSDGSSEDAHIVGRDVQTDLAVIRVPATGSLQPIEWGESSQLRIGQPVVALGAPLGLANTVTTGIVSALERSVNVPADNGRTALLVSAIQTDAAINPGNSGGALVDCATRLVGVPTAGATVPNPQGGSSSGNVGIGFAIPADFAHAISDEIIAHGSVTHSSFGVRVAEVSGNESAGTPSGLYVIAPTPGGPSASAGIRTGDVITKLDGQVATSAEQLQALTLTRRPGDTVRVTFERDGSEHEADITLGAQPASS
jgi:putative serine protease PepD